MNRFTYSFILVLCLFVSLADVILAQKSIINPYPHHHFNNNLRLTENKGQWHSNVRYRTTTGSQWIYLENDRIKYQIFDANQLRQLHPAAPGSLPFKYLSGHTYTMTFIGANKRPLVDPFEAFYDYENYFIGNDPQKWAQFVRSYSGLKYKDIYPGIDLSIKTNENSLKYDFIVAPEADVRKIQLQYAGVGKIVIKNGKSIIIKTCLGEIIENIPAAWQEIEGTKVPILCEYKLINDSTVGFHFPNGYINDFPLIIDPELIFSTYTGSRSDNWGMTATYDRSGNLYSGGVVNGAEYPVTNGAFQATYAGGARVFNDFAQVSVGFTCDMAIVKYNPLGTTRLYSTYIGGTNNEQPASIIANEKEELYILGTTRSNNFPVTNNAYDRDFNGRTDEAADGDIDMVVLKLNAAGSELLGSTYIGGNAEDGTNRVNTNTTINPLYYFFADNGRGEIVIDADDNCYVVASTTSRNFPITPNAPQPNFRGDQDAVVFSLNGDMSQLRWSTFLGGAGIDAGYSLKLNNKNELYVVGGTTSQDFFQNGANGWQRNFNGGVADGFLIHYSSDGGQVLESSFIGTNAFDQTYFIDLDDEFNVYIAGISEGDFPVIGTSYNIANGRQYVVKLKPDLSEPIFSFRYGSGIANRRRPDITLTAFLVDVCQNIYIAGWGSNGNTLRPFFIDNPAITSGNTTGLPVTNDAFERNTTGSDFYLAVFNRDAESLRYATFIGGTHTADHVDGGTSRFDKNGIIYHSVCGSCQPGADPSCPKGPLGGCSDFPTTPNAVSRTNNSRNCNNLNFKFNLDILDAALAEFNFDTSGNEFCLPLKVNFRNQSKGAVRYEWDLGDGITTTEEHPSHIYTQAGKYRVKLKAINEEKCNGSDETFREITIREPSKAHFKLTIDTCLRTIKIENLSENSSRYAWYYGDGKVWLGNNPPDHIYEEHGIYIFKLITDAGTPCADTLEQVLDFRDIASPMPKVLQKPCNPEVDFASNVASSVPVLWELGDGQISNLHNFTHSYKNIGVFKIKLTIYPGLECAKTWIDSVTIEEKKPADFSHTPLTCLRTVSFRCNTPTDSVRWDFGDGTSSFELNPTHLYVEEGDYIVSLITNPGGFCADTIEKSLTFKPLPPARINVIFNRCKFDIETENLTDSIITKHYWDFGDNQTDTTRNPRHTYSQPGLYLVTYIANPDGNDCSKKVSQQIEIFPKSIADFKAQPNCFREVVFYENSQFATTFHWDFGDGSKGTGPAPFHRYALPGIYRVTLITNQGNSCADTNIQNIVVPVPSTADFRYEVVPCTGEVRFFNLSGETFNGYYWDFGDGTTSTEQNPIHIYKTRGSYAVRLTTNPGSICPNMKEDIVQPMPRSYAEINMPELICDSAVTFAHRARNTISFLWSVNDSIISRDANPVFKFVAGRSHRIRLITDPEGPCPDTANVSVNVQKIPEARFEPVFAPCDLFVRFDNFSKDAHQFYWEFGDGTNSDKEFPSHTYAEYGNYLVRLTVNKDSLCYDISERNFFFGNPPDIGFSIEIDACDSIVTLKPNRAIAQKFFWDFGDGNTSTEREPVHRYLKHGKYTITLVTDEGTLCEKNMAKEIELKKELFAGFEASQVVCENTVIFKNKSKGNGKRFLWNFGDGNWSWEENPIHKYKDSNIYQIKLVIIDANGCTDTILKKIDFSSIGGAILDIPNVFTPNGDGINERFDITGPFAACFEHIMIFDRWGVKVFESNNLSDTWDGTFNGSPVPEGAYVYLITVKGTKRVGTVSVIR